ncbi:MAG: Tol-Pal system beta propeller repeat protein TolB [Halofilum sp. (in: g-proteobacteria)]|nr:Tol-Pal system beta propeller repeat protein TolB [Halofilum sp. (in: g-proteobacteria)]
MRPLIALVLLGWSMQAAAVLQIEITEGATGARPIAVVPFGWSGPGQRPADLAGIVSSDLARSGQFAPIERRDMVSRPTAGEGINFGNWRTLGVDHVVVGSIDAASGGGYRVRFQLFDVVRQRQAAGYSFEARANAMRGLAHEISDVVYEEITGERGAFNTRIAFVSTEGSAGDRSYQLQVSDYDGYNARPILTSRQPIMSPAWSPDGERVAYVSFEEGTPAVFVQEVATGERRQVSRRAGINGAPAWSPDGSRLAVALSFEGNPEIYVLDLDGGDVQRVTRSGAIDTSPAWLPGGESLVFTSDRSGGPQLYQARADGSGSARRLTFEGKYNAAPDVSPNGERIAFVHRTEGNQYRIAVFDRSSDLMRVVTDGRLDESPTFAPNGRMILYATEHGGRGVLGAVSADGRVAVRLSQAQGNIREPAWGPFRD